MSLNTLLALKNSNKKYFIYYLLLYLRMDSKDFKEFDLSNSNDTKNSNEISRDDFKSINKINSDQ